VKNSPGPALLDPEKKKARVTKADEKGGNETSNHGDIAQGTQAPHPGNVTGAVLEKASSTRPPSYNYEDNNTNINREGPSQQNTKNLWTAQTKYHDMMRTREELKSRKAMLDWEIRFGPKHGVTEEKIMAMGKERKSVA